MSFRVPATNLFRVLSGSSQKSDGSEVQQGKLSNGRTAKVGQISKATPSVTPKAAEVLKNNDSASSAAKLEKGKIATFGDSLKSTGARIKTSISNISFFRSKQEINTPIPEPPMRVDLQLEALKNPVKFFQDAPTENAEKFCRYFEVNRKLAEENGMDVTAFDKAFIDCAYADHVKFLPVFDEMAKYLQDKPFGFAMAEMAIDKEGEGSKATFLRSNNIAGKLISVCIRHTERDNLVKLLNNDKLNNSIKDLMTLMSDNGAGKDNIKTFLENMQPSEGQTM